MSKVDRKQIKNMILKEMRMLGMADMMPMSDPPPSHGHGGEEHGVEEGGKTIFPDQMKRN